MAPRGTRDTWGDVVAARMRDSGCCSSSGFGVGVQLEPSHPTGMLHPPTATCVHGTYPDSPGSAVTSAGGSNQSLCPLSGGTLPWGGFNPAVRAPAPHGFGASPQRLLQGERGLAGWLEAGISSSRSPRRLFGQGGSGQAPRPSPGSRRKAALLFVIHRHIPRTQQPRTALFPGSSRTPASTPRENTRRHVAGL